MSDLDLTALSHPGLTFREAAREDIPALVEMERAIWPRELWTTEAARDFRWEPLDQHGRNYRVAGETEGRIVVYACCAVSVKGDPRDWGQIEIEILPEWRRRGLGSLLFRYMERLATDAGVKLLYSWSVSALPGGDEFLTKMGLSVASRESFSRLEIERANLDPFRRRFEELRTGGYEFFRLDERDDPETRRAAHALAVHIDQEMPTDGEPPPEMTCEAWDKWVYGGNPCYGPDHIHIAAFRGELVGMTGLAVEGDGVGMTYTTGVVRAHRGKGIAGALKYLSLTNALAMGIKIALTSNSVKNAPMLSINRRLGYIHAYDAVEFQLRLCA